MANSYNCLTEYYSKLCVNDQKKWIAGWQNAELISIMVLTWKRFYCCVLACWAQYRTFVLFELPKPLNLAYQCGLGLRSFTDDKTCDWIIALDEYILVAGNIFVITSGHGARRSHAICSLHFNRVNSSILCLLSVKDPWHPEVLWIIQVRITEWC